MQSEEMIRIPLIAMRGLVVFPGSTVHFDVTRRRSAAAIDLALKKGTPVFVIAQRDFREEDPHIDGLYEIGTIAIIKQVLRVSDDNVRVLVEGLSRGHLVDMTEGKQVQMATVERIYEQPAEDEAAALGAVRELQAVFEEYSMGLPKLSPEVVLSVLAIEEPGALADYVTANISMRYDSKQKVLDCLEPVARLRELITLLRREIEIMRVENEIRSQVKEQIDQNHREYYLREQMKAIQSELGEGEDVVGEAMGYRARLEKLKLAPELSDPLLKEINRLSHMSPSSSEAAVIRTYLDTCLELPWNTVTKDKLDLDRVRARLDKDHYGLDKVKERIIEQLAVQKLTKNKNSQVICLVGPPGVGKTSVAISIAGAIGRKFARIALGGIRDEAEIRGHRKTYIGAMPGRIINAVSKAKSRNPLILLDEIDKLTSDMRGDPAAALLEVLDTEQNGTFRDHYIELPFDLSDVLFITTANNKDTIPRPLLDRMEIIELSSYTDAEKLHIARDHLIPKQIKKHGLTKRDLAITDPALSAIIDGYTREAGVRTLERRIAAVCRKAAAAKVGGATGKKTVLPDDLTELLGPQRYKREKDNHKNEVGLVNGLAWTSVGGEMLKVEVAVLEGTGKVKFTGSLGDVMKESCDAAVTYIRSRSESLGIDKDFYKTKDIHIHFPEGAVPKDGPSAGIAITTAVTSALTGRPVRGDLAMTGEVTLRGRVLAIGGLKEKTMAAYREGLRLVVLPEENKADLEEIDADVRRGLQFVTVSDVGKVLDLALLPCEITALRADAPTTAEEEPLPIFPADLRPEVGMTQS
ncbi:MAG: endopeptidase La [Clostridia bacterium]|nr:endopeptidase La [Clostridia bacterium]